MGRRKGSGRAVRQNRQSQNTSEPEELRKAPHSFVINRGKIGARLGELVTDFRRVMEPYTAKNLKVLRRNVLKDFVSVAGVLNVTHLVIFTQSAISPYLRICRLPRGPSLTFRIENYCLTRDTISSLKKHFAHHMQYLHHPFLVLNNFSGEGMHLKLMTTMFQNMFPSINVNNVNLNNVQRCILVNRNPDTDSIDFRHYAIKVVPTGISRGVKKIIQSKIPDLSRCEDISEMMTKGGMLSESEAEQDGPHNEVILPQQLSGKGNIVSQKSAVRLIELGPRFTLQLIKIEEGLMGGDVLFHKHIQKTEEEIKAIKARLEKRRKLKEYRRQQQQVNVKKKVDEKNKHKERCLEGMQKEQSSTTARPSSKMDDEIPKDEEAEDSAEEDKEWYRKEVGEEPDRDIFPSSGKRKISREIRNPMKKQKTDHSIKKTLKRYSKTRATVKNKTLKRRSTSTRNKLNGKHKKGPRQRNADSTIQRGPLKRGIARKQKRKL